MRIGRPLFQSIASSAIVAIGCIGAEVTPDLLGIAAIAFVAGSASFILALLEDRRSQKIIDDQTAKLDNQSEKIDNQMSLLAEQSTNIKGLVSSLGSLMPPTPISIQNLASLPVETLRKQIARVVAELRLFHAKLIQEQTEELFSLIPTSPSPEKNKVLWNQHVDELMRNSARQRAELEEIRPNGVALWEELKRRLPDAPEAPWMKTIALTEGALSGISPVANAADELERLARLLPND